MKDKARLYRSSVLEEQLKKRDPLKTVQVKFKMGLAARLEDILNELGWNKKHFANQLGKSPSIITKWLSGTHNFTVDTITEIEFVTGRPLYPINQQQRIKQYTITFPAIAEDSAPPEYITLGLSGDKNNIYVKKTDTD